MQSLGYSIATGMGEHRLKSPPWQDALFLSTVLLCSWRHTRPSGKSEGPVCEVLVTVAGTWKLSADAGCHGSEWM